MFVQLISKIKFFSFLLNHPLNKGNSLKTLVRYFRWQFGSRLVPGDVLVPFIDDTVLCVKPGMTGATGNIYAGLHEFEDMAFCLHLLRPTDLFVDIGANIGSYTILGGGVGARCISVEPIKKTYDLLVRNINFNAMGSLVKSLNIGIGKESGILRFTNELDTVNHVLSTSEGKTGGVEVPVIALDELLKTEEPTLIKIDVEGFETNVVDGANEVLSRSSLLAVLMELNGSGDRYGFDETALHKKMLSYGFETFRYSPFDRQLISLNGSKSKSGNTLYVRSNVELRARLVESRKYFIANVAREI